MLQLDQTFSKHLLNASYIDIKPDRQSGTLHELYNGHILMFGSSLLADHTVAGNFIAQSLKRVLVEICQKYSRLKISAVPESALEYHQRQSRTHHLRRVFPNSQTSLLYRCLVQRAQEYLGLDYLHPLEH